MSERKLIYSVCKYVPDLMRGEAINVGIVVHSPEDKRVLFRAVKNFSRIRAFDDEVDIDILKALLESIDVQFNTASLLEDEKELSSLSLLNNELIYFVNQIQFDEIKTILSSNIEQDISDLVDTYLYYEKKKSNRISSERVRNLASRLVTNSELKKNINRHPNIKNNFEQVPVDFTLNIHGEDVYFKALTFDYQNRNMFLKELKNILYDIDELKDFEIKILINNVEIEKDYEKLAIDSLKNKGVEVLTLAEFSRFIDCPKVTGQTKLFN